MVHFCLGPTVVYSNHVGYSPLCSLNQLQFAFTRPGQRPAASQLIGRPAVPSHDSVRPTDRTSGPENRSRAGEMLVQTPPARRPSRLPYGAGGSRDTTGADSASANAQGLALWSVCICQNYVQWPVVVLSVRAIFRSLRLGSTTVSSVC